MTENALSFLGEFIDKLYEDMDDNDLRPVFMSVEMSGGEGLVLKMDVPSDFPIYERVVFPPIPFPEDTPEFIADTINLLNEVPHVYRLLHDSMGGRIVSLHAAPSWVTDADYLDKTTEQANDLATAKGHVTRVVMEDGMPHEITADLNEDRINLHTSNDIVYRAEFY